MKNDSQLNLIHKLIINILNINNKLKKRIKRLIDKKKIGSFEFRMNINALERMYYAYICYNSAKLAKQLGKKKISVIEYGVASGRGLLILEEYADEIEKLLGVQLEVYGFDMGSGLPKPKDYRDLPHHWKEGFFVMDEDKLRSKLKKAKLIIGDIETTSKNFFSEYKPSPIGAIVHDLDFYSSTKSAMSMLKTDEKNFLPRVHCFFDDTIGDETVMFSDFTGERLAINEFNKENENIKFSKPYHLLTPGNEIWHHQIWICHFFKHKEYNAFVSEPDQQL
tara:strand:+ start:7075 stop:7911 length:837 start_codon:yes stop_codon:yes gene_type:complete